MPGRIEAGCPNHRHHHRRKNLRHRFEVVKTLGQGTYGKVKLAIERDSGEAYAIKSIRKKQIGTDQDLTRLRREIEIMTRLNHPHIISVYEVFENSDKIILVMEYASGGELYDYCNDKRGLYDEEARKFFRQIISAVHYLHMNGIVHRDLKLENIVLDSNGDAKIADFGFANIYSDDKLLSTFCGSPLYASPEIVNGLPYHGPEVDCWSLGVLLYAVVYGAMPFDGSDFRRLRNQITAGEYFKPSKPSDAEGMISELLCPNAARRASIGEIMDHWWLNLGYEHTPIDDILPGKPVDHKTLLRKLSDGSFSESDCDVLTPDDLSHSSCSHSASQPNESQSSTPPIKGILKKPTEKKSTPIGSPMKCDKPPLQRSQSLDVNINIAGSFPVPSQQSEISPKNANPAFDSTKKPKKSILKKRHSHYGGDCESMTQEMTMPEYDLVPFSPNPEFESSEELNAENSDSHSICESDHMNMDRSNECSGSYDLGDIEAVLDSMLDDAMFDVDGGARVDTSDGQMTEDSGCDLSSAEASPIMDQQSEALTFPSGSKPDNIFESSLTSTPRAVTSGRRKKGILKNGNNQTWRYSTGSQGSSSSNDILDYSYDSTDGDMLLSEYFSMPLVNDDSGALEISDIPDQYAEDDNDDNLGPPPPLPDCPPPDYVNDARMESQEAFNTDCDSDTIIEKILWLGNQDVLPQSPENFGSPTVIDWSEVEDIYRKAMELHQEWT